MKQTANVTAAQSVHESGESASIFYPESRFGGFTDIDGTIAFYSRVNALLDSSFVVLDFGCGRGRHRDDAIKFRRDLRCLKQKVCKVIGIDVGHAGSTNPTLDEFRLLVPGSPWPLPDESVNMIVCDCVLEHLSEPAAFFYEAKRVLAPGGYLCIRTTNVHSYIGIVSRLVPNRYHGSILSRAQIGQKAEDNFPTCYRCNTISSLRRCLRKANFDGVVYGYEAEPQYLSFSRFAYAIGVIHQIFAPGFLKPCIFAFAQSRRS